MFIQELAQLTGVSTKTIRYYESIGLLPPPQRAENNYRQYTSTDVERLRIITSTRMLGFSLAKIAEFLAARDGGTLHNQQVLDSFDQHLAEIDRHITDLLVLRDMLDRIRREGAALSPDNVCGEQCICYLITTQRESGRITIQREEPYEMSIQPVIRNRIH